MNIEVRVPDGISGPWKIESFKVSDDEAKLSSIRSMFSSGRDEAVAAGSYKRLCRGSTVVMSNTPMEIRTHRQFIRMARGNVLINGLGLGMALAVILEKPEVQSVTIIEISEDVIRLVSPTFADDPRVTIIHADAFTWTPPKNVRYDAVWHDIWDYICADNLPEMVKLHRKYGRRSNWQGSWARPECEDGKARRY